MLPCSPWRSMVEQISTCSPWKGPHAGAGGCLKEDVTPWGALHWSRFFPGPVERGERSPHQSRFAGRAYDPVGDPRWSSLFLKDCTLWKAHMEKTHTGAVCEDLQPVGKTHIGEFVEDCVPQEGPHAGAGAECEESSH